MDRLCLSGAVSWGRLTPHPRFSQAGETDQRRIVPTSLAPISLFPRDNGEWLLTVTSTRLRFEPLRVTSSTSRTAFRNDGEQIRDRNRSSDTSRTRELSLQMQKQRPSLFAKVSVWRYAGSVLGYVLLNAQTDCE